MIGGIFPEPIALSIPYKRVFVIVMLATITSTCLEYTSGHEE